MAYKLRSQDLKDTTAGTTSAAIRAGGEERRAQRGEMREIRQGLRDVRKDIKSIDINWDNPNSSNVDALHAVSARKDELISRKADVKDWSTRKRVRKGDKEGVNLHGNIEAHTKKGEALYKSGSYYGDTKVDIGDIRADQEADTEMNTSGQEYTNKYTIGGDYKYSYPTPVDPAKPNTPRISPPERPDITPPPKWKHSKEKGKLKANTKKTRVVQNKLKQERVKKVAPLKTAVANLFGNPTIQFKKGRAKTRDRKNDLYSNTRSKKREWKKGYKEARKSYKKGRREDIAAQKADFRQERRDWWRSQFS